MDKPAMIIELKWDKNVQGAIAQIEDKKYTDALKDYHGNILLVGINYNKKTKEHTCILVHILLRSLEFAKSEFF